MKKSYIKDLITGTAQYIIQSARKGAYVENGGEYAVNGGYPQGGYNSIFSKRLSELATSAYDPEGTPKASVSGIRKAQKYLIEKGVDLEARFKAYHQRHPEYNADHDRFIPNRAGCNVLMVGDYIVNVNIIVTGKSPEILLEVTNQVKWIAGDYGDHPSECVTSIVRGDDGVYRNGGSGNPIKAEFFTVDEFVDKYGH